jgi:hypothetical protein
MAEKKPLNPVWVAAKPFVNGGLSGMAATCIIQPIDMVKVRQCHAKAVAARSGVYSVLIPVERSPLSRVLNIRPLFCLLQVQLQLGTKGSPVSARRIES